MITVNYIDYEKARQGDFMKKWISTDGWRGYYKVTASKKSRWEFISSDWVTGDWSDAGENAASSQEERIEKLEADLNQEGFELALVLSPTSNCFSTGMDLFKRKI